MANELIRMAVLVAALTLCAGTASAKDGNGEGNAQKQPPKQQQQQYEPQKHKKQPAQQQQQQQAAEHGKKHGEGAGDAHDANDAASDANNANDKRRAHKRAEGEADGTDHAAARKADRDSAQDKPAKSEKNDKNQEQRQENADQREQNQARRIHNGVKHGQLTPDEIGKLDAQEKALADSEAKFKSDGKLTRDESRQLQQQLNDASEQIWAQRHDTEGNQRSVVRLGKEVIARDDLTQRIESGELTGPEARKFAADFRKMIGIKKRLASDDLAEDDRAALQDEYDGLLGNYFQINEDKQSKVK